MKVFLARNGTELGPVDSLHTLRQMVASGRIYMTDHARVESDAEWRTVRQFIADHTSVGLSSIWAYLKCVLRVVIVATLVIGAIIMAIDHHRRSSRLNVIREEKAEREAILRDVYYTATEFVRAGLKVPDTAQFKPYKSDGNTTGASYTQSDCFRAWGQVKAQNSFGVPITTEWEAELASRGNGWRMMHLRIGSQEIQR